MTIMSSRLSRSALAPPVVLLAVATAGCVSAPRMEVQTAITPTEQFAIEVRPEPDQLLLSARSPELSQAQAQALAGLAMRWREAATGPLTIQAPAGSQNAAAGFGKATAAAQALAGFGVPPGAIVTSSYAAAGRSDAPVQVGFVRQVAVGPDCAGRHSDLTATYANAPTGSFGCAVTANFAAQLANAADLSAPREMTPADATRRGVVMGKYQRGEPTGTPRSDNPREAANIQDEADR